MSLREILIKSYWLSDPEDFKDWNIGQLFFGKHYAGLYMLICIILYMVFI